MPSPSPARPVNSFRRALCVSLSVPFLALAQVLQARISQRTADRMRRIPFFAAVRENKPWSKLDILVPARLTPQSALDCPCPSVVCCRCCFLRVFRRAACACASSSVPPIPARAVLVCCRPDRSVQSASCLTDMCLLCQCTQGSLFQFEEHPAGHVVFEQDTVGQKFYVIVQVSFESAAFAAACLCCRGFPSCGF